MIVMKCFGFFMLISSVCLANTRQIRYSRYNAQVIDDNLENSNATKQEDEDIEIEATVRELKLNSYPASGFKPSKVFLLPNERATTDIPDEAEGTSGNINLITTTQGYESETTINRLLDGNEEFLVERENLSPPYPPAGFQPKVPFLLPTENKAFKKQQQQLAEYTSEQSQPKHLNPSDNASHPVCGSSTNPLSPKPKDGESSDPDSELINIDAATQKKSQ